MRPAAFITGGARRIGRAIALALAGRGYDVALHYHRSRDEAQRTAEDLAAAGARCELFRCDLSDTPALDGLIGGVFEALPRCRVLVNNASIFQRGDFLDTDDDLLERHWRVNFKAPFALSQAFARRCESGQIVNLLDAKIARAHTPYFAYQITKKALEAFTDLAAKALAPRIRVNAVCPGLILAPPGAPADALEKIAARVPLKRTGSPEAVARAVLFLVENDYVTGQSVFVDGGEHLT